MFFLVLSLLVNCGEDNLEELTFQDASLKVKGSIKLTFLRAYGGLKKAFGPIINPLSKIFARVFEAVKRAFWEIYTVICQSFTNWFHIIARNSKKLSNKIHRFQFLQQEPKEPPKRTDQQALNEFYVRDIEQTEKDVNEDE
ncbi:hypothetical protein GPJ56_006074 [Histomonas meleagridis]|uniref:uncharacterized protein n=1 Tax=Histomonas meleagridis TaxID=135588 RepID=UPI00355AC821|nr:hypothetical protein GPJ56_006074 [Histomonas meleagridis]KAH0807182.1 hypothetical protein GO595_000358 [Histomonas meleagridis]